MNIGGLEKSSLIDYPEKVAAVIFLQGCNFRCCYCHNPELVDPKHFSKPLNEDKVLDFLKSRTHVLDGVVISGGEPTVHQDLPSLIRRIKTLGYLVKLDTNGSNPEMLHLLIKSALIDFVAMDLKAPFHKYKKVCQREGAWSQVAQSLALIEQSALPYQFRTTYDQDILDEDDLSEMRRLLKEPERLKIQPKRALSKVLTGV